MINLGEIMKKNKIGISLRVVHIPNYDENRDALSHDWTLFLEKLNLIPILIPNKIANVSEFLDDVGVEATAQPSVGRHDHQQRRALQRVGAALGQEWMRRGVHLRRQTAEHAVHLVGERSRTHNPVLRLAEP